MIIKIRVYVIMVCAVITYSFAQSHDYERGYKHENDSLLHRASVFRPPDNRTIYQDVEFPAWNQSNDAVIHYMAARDHDTNDTGGYVNLNWGGICLKKVSLEVKSQMGKGFNFTIEIWGNDDLCP